MHIIIDPDRDGATIWNVDRKTVYHVKGTPRDITDRVFKFCMLWDEEENKYIQVVHIDLDLTLWGRAIYDELTHVGVRINIIRPEHVGLFKL